MAVYAAGKNLSIPISYGQGVANQYRNRRHYIWIGDGRKHPPVCDKSHPVQCTENEWRYGKHQANVGIIESYLVITKTHLYNFDPLKPHFYIVKLGFTGVYIIFLISAQKHRLWVLKNIDCGYSLEPPRRGGSNEYQQSMFWAEMWKKYQFFIWKFSVFGGEFFYIFA